METKELQLLGSIPMTKQAQADFVAGMVEAATNGEHSPLKIIAQAKSMAAMLKAFIDDESVKNAVLNEFAREFGDCKSGKWDSVEFQRKEVGVKYDYSVSGDWQLTNKAVKQAEANRKAIEERLKTASPACPYVDISTGEEIGIVPKSSETQVAVTIK